LLSAGDRRPVYQAAGRAQFCRREFITLSSSTWIDGFQIKQMLETKANNGGRKERVTSAPWTIIKSRHTIWRASEPR
jgi:hypothetical protein